MVLYYAVQFNIFTKNCQNHLKVTTNQLEGGGGLEPIVSSLQKVKMYVKRYRVAKGAISAKVTRVTTVPRLKGLLRDGVFSRTHLRLSLTSEEGPSCYNVNSSEIKLDLSYFAKSYSMSY